MLLAGSLADGTLPPLAWPTSAPSRCQAIRVAGVIRNPVGLVPREFRHARHVSVAPAWHAIQWALYRGNSVPRVRAGKTVGLVPRSSARHRHCPTRSRTSELQRFVRSSNSPGPVVYAGGARVSWAAGFRAFRHATRARRMACVLHLKTASAYTTDGVGRAVEGRHGTQRIRRAEPERRSV